MPGKSRPDRVIPTENRATAPRSRHKQRHAIPRPNRCGCCNLRAAWVRPRNRLRCSLRNRTQSGIIPGELMKTFWVYIMSNKSRRLYVGMTSTLIKARVPA